MARPTTEDGHTSGEDEGEEEVAAVDDSEILEDLPDDTEVRQQFRLVHVLQIDLYVRKLSSFTLG